MLNLITPEVQQTIEFSLLAIGLIGIVSIAVFATKTTK